MVRPTAINQTGPAEPPQSYITARGAEQRPLLFRVWMLHVTPYTDLPRTVEIVSANSAVPTFYVNHTAIETSVWDVRFRLARRLKRTGRTSRPSSAPSRSPPRVWPPPFATATALSRVEVALRAPRPVRPDLDHLRAALEQRATEWKSTLRSEPKVARLLLRRLDGPLTLWDEPEGGARWEAETTTSLLDSLVHHMASPEGFEPSLPA